MKTTLSICIASAVMAGCQTTALKTHTASNPTTLNSKQANQSISLEELEDKHWGLYYAINPNGYVINLDKWHPNGERSTFDFDKNSDREAYRYLTDKDDLMNFSFGCNGFSTGFSLIDNKLVIDEAITQTLIGCGDTEDELRDALKGQNQLEYERKTNQLTITTHNHYRFILQGMFLLNGKFAL